MDYYISFNCNHSCIRAYLVIDVEINSFLRFITPALPSTVVHLQALTSLKCRCGLR